VSMFLSFARPWTSITLHVPRPGLSTPSSWMVFPLVTSLRYRRRTGLSLWSLGHLWRMRLLVVSRCLSPFSFRYQFAHDREGITFTYGGLKTDASAHVLNDGGERMPGLWAIGECSGGFFAFNYPGAAGLVKGAVFGRIAGRDAAKRAAESSRSNGTSDGALSSRL
jgi:hypothetical protein